MRPSEAPKYASAAHLPALALPSRPNPYYLDWIRGVVTWRRIAAFVWTAPILAILFVACRWVVEYSQIAMALTPLTRKLLSRTIVFDPFSMRNSFTWPLGLCVVVPLFITVLLAVSPWLGSVASRSVNSLYLTSDEDVDADDFDLDEFESEEQLLSGIGRTVGSEPSSSSSTSSQAGTGQSAGTGRTSRQSGPFGRKLRSIRTRLCNGTDSSLVGRIFALVALIIAVVIANISFGFSTSHYVLALQGDGSIDVALPASFLESSTFAAFLRSTSHAPMGPDQARRLTLTEDSLAVSDGWATTEDTIATQGESPDANKSYSIRRRTHGLTGALLALLPSDRWLVTWFSKKAKPDTEVNKDNSEKSYTAPDPLDLVFLFTTFHAIFVAVILWLSPPGSNRATSPVSPTIHVSKSRLAHVLEATPRILCRTLKASFRILCLSFALFAFIALVISSTRAARVRRDLRVALELEGPNLDSLIFGLHNNRNAASERLAAASAAALGLPKHLSTQLLAQLNRADWRLDSATLKETVLRDSSLGGGLLNTISNAFSRVGRYTRKMLRSIGVPQLLVGSDADDVYYEYIRSRLEHSASGLLTAPPLVIANGLYDQPVTHAFGTPTWTFNDHSPVLATSGALSSGRMAVFTYLKDGIIYTIDKQVLPPPKRWMLALLAIFRAYVVACFFVLALMFQREVLQLVLREPLAFEGYLLHGLAHVEAPLARLLAYLDLLRILETDPERAMRLIADGLPAKFALINVPLPQDATASKLNPKAASFGSRLDHDNTGTRVMTTLPTQRTSLDVPFIFDYDPIPNHSVLTPAALAQKHLIASGLRAGLLVGLGPGNPLPIPVSVSTASGHRSSSTLATNQFPVLQAYQGPIPTLAAVHAATTQYLVTLYTKRLYTHIIHDLRREARAPKTVRQMIAASMFGGLLRLGSSNVEDNGQSPSIIQKLMESIVTLPAPPASERFPVLSLLPLMFTAMMRTLVLLLNPFESGSSPTATSGPQVVRGTGAKESSEGFSFLGMLKRFVILPMAAAGPRVLVAITTFNPLRELKNLVAWLVACKDGETDESAVDLQLIGVAMHAYTTLLSQARFVQNSAAPGFVSQHLLPSALTALAQLSAALDLYVARGLKRSRALRMWQHRLSTATATAMAVSPADTESASGAGRRKSQVRSALDASFEHAGSGLLTAAELRESANASVLATAAGVNSVDDLNRQWMDDSPYAMTCKFCFVAEADVNRAISRLVNIFYPLLNRFAFPPDVAARLNVLLNN